jgi:hypothetical protein
MRMPQVTDRVQYEGALSMQNTDFYGTKQDNYSGGIGTRNIGSNWLQTGTKMGAKMTILVPVGMNKTQNSDFITCLMTIT